MEAGLPGRTIKVTMHSSHDPRFIKRENSWKPTIGLAWLHFALAYVCAILAVTSIAPPMLGIVGMAFFAGVAMVFVLLTIPRLR